MGTSSRAKARRKGDASKAEEDVQARRARLMRELLSRRTPEQTLDALEENALRAVRALGAELTRRATAEEKEGLFYGGSVSRRDRILGELFAALTGEETGRPLAVTAEDVLRAAKAEAAVEAFLEGQGVPEEERWFPDPGLLAKVLAEVPGALWSQRVLRILELLGTPSPDGPLIVVIRHEDGPPDVVNLGSQAVSFGDWLGFSNTKHSERGHSLEPAWADPDGLQARRAVAEALKGLVDPPRVDVSSREWRPARARSEFFACFWDAERKTYDYRSFRELTGVRPASGERAGRDAFRKCAVRTKEEARKEKQRLEAIEQVGRPGQLRTLEMSRVAAASSRPTRGLAREERAKEDERQKEEKGTRRSSPEPGERSGQPASGADARGSQHAGIRRREDDEGTLEAQARGRRAGVPAHGTPDPRQGRLPEGGRDRLGEVTPRGEHDNRGADPRRVVRGRRVRKPP